MITKKYKTHHWVGEKPDPENYFGFLYAVVNIKNSMVYVGRKQYRGKRSRKDGSYYEVNSKWEFYESSSKYLKEDISKIGKEYFLFILLKNFNTPSDLDSSEVNLLRELNVLKQGNIFYNRNIGGELFRTPFTNNIKRQKRDNIKGENNPMWGKKHSDDAKRRTGEASKERGISEETKHKMLVSRTNNTKVYKFTHSSNKVFIGTVKQMVENFPNTKDHGIKELVRGKTYDKTCISGYSMVHSRYGWVKAECIGIKKDLEELIIKYGEEN